MSAAITDRTAIDELMFEVTQRLGSALYTKPGTSSGFGHEAAFLRRIKERIEGLEEVLADKRRLTRELDVALCGQEKAAEQASLCDLIPMAQAMRGLLLAARCPYCDDVGWYVVANRNTGEPEQQQCQWCDERAKFK